MGLWAHFEGEAQGYRPDLHSVPEHDPISTCRDRLLEVGALTDGQYQVSVGAQVEGAERASAVIVTWFVEFGDEVTPASLLAGVALDKVEGSVIAPGTWTHRWARPNWSCRPRRTSGELVCRL